MYFMPITHRSLFCKGTITEEYIIMPINVNGNSMRQKNSTCILGQCILNLKLNQTSIKVKFFIHLITLKTVTLAV